jgi:hypothetical protein
MPTERPAATDATAGEHDGVRPALRTIHVVCGLLVVVATAVAVHADIGPGSGVEDSGMGRADMGSADTGRADVGRTGTSGAGVRRRGPSRPSGPAVGGSSPGWQVTVYYTAVEGLHSGRSTRVIGCQRLDCANGGADLGTYPAGFVAAVRAEGTGRTRSGRYLNWSSNVGYWLDSAPRDAHGAPLRPWVSAAADPDVLPAGTTFMISECGRAEEGGPVGAPVCARLRAARWVVTDEFTPGLGGERHVDLYVGEETGPGFTESEWFTTLVGAVLLLNRP